MNLFVFGLGYSASHYVAAQTRFERVIATKRAPNPTQSASDPHLVLRRFDGTNVDPAILDDLAAVNALLVSIPPDENGDPTIACFREAIARATQLQSIVYLSTIGVYGDWKGAWIDEDAECRPINDRSQRRLMAEHDWLTLGAETGAAVHILRLAGIYGPGASAVDNLRHGVARRIVKPGQVFNRIHVDDIAATIDACWAYRGRQRIWNICDDEPAPAEDVVTCAAELLGLAPPPLVRIEEAKLSPMALSFYEECKRCRNDAMKHELRARLRYPTYREGLRAIVSARAAMD